MALSSLTIDEIMRRFNRVCPRPPNIRFRHTLHHNDDRRWYVELPGVVWAFAEGAFLTLVHGFEGPTPDDALTNAWTKLMETQIEQPLNFLMLYTCPSNVPIPGNTPQAWVRWNIEREEWEDVVPTAETLEAWGIPADRIFPYNSFEIHSRH